MFNSLYKAMRRYLQLGRGDFIQYLMELSEYANQILKSPCVVKDVVQYSLSQMENLLLPPFQAGVVARCIRAVHAHADRSAGECGARDECAGGGAGGAAPARGAAAGGVGGRHGMGPVLTQLPPRRAARDAVRAQHDALPAGLLVPLVLEAHRVRSRAPLALADDLRAPPPRPPRYQPISSQQSLCSLRARHDI